ncbi:YceI family protein [Leucobacter denitrificans]|uniref:YceI family protein n=1 Tax=Leucobacter denitrificans TaxID=683042 RepID=UPI001FEC2CFB|nr:YceI family protein [Leucobacter denitrificans]
MLRGTDVTVTGRTSEVTGSLEISDDGLTLETAEFTVDVASIATDQSQRDSYFRDSAIRVSENPEAGFVLTSPVTVDALPEAGEIVELEITGDLSIAGETNAVTTVVQVRSDGSTTELAGSIPITFADYGVEAPSLGFVKVEDNGFVEFQLVAMKG